MEPHRLAAHVYLLKKAYLLRKVDLETTILIMRVIGLSLASRSMALQSR